MLELLFESIRTYADGYPAIYVGLESADGCGWLMLQRFGIEVPPRLHLLPPSPYMAFLSLWARSTLVITGSGGLQEETTALGTPCITVRENTERPITPTEGANVMVGRDPARIVEEACQVLDGPGKVGRRPALCTAVRQSESWRFWSAAKSTHVGQSPSVLYADGSDWYP
jgi:hypothetical protein